MAMDIKPGVQQQEPQLYDEPPTKKRAARFVAEVGEETRKRGRPRVDRQDDVSAADRRRRQIREAQRAYRQRKESTLDELRKRVSDLQSIVEQMNQTFVDSVDRLNSNGLSEHQLSDMREATLRFAALTDTARNPPDDYNNSGSPQDHHSKSLTPPAEFQPVTKPVARNVPGWLDQTIASQPPRQPIMAGIGMGYSVYMGGDLNVVPPAPADNVVKQLPSPIESMQQSDAFPPGTQFFQHSTSSLPQQLPNPTTYSFQESTFGRRLHRATIEAAYTLILVGKKARPLTYERVFKLSLMSRDPSKVASGFKALLDSPPNAELDLWTAPLVYVGGAGTHYPKLDAYGNMHPRKRPSNSPALYGPQDRALVLTEDGRNITPDLTIDLAGYEGEWFDPYDVEGYLLEKGIRLDPNASFTECEILDWPSMSASVSTVSGSKSPMTPDSTHFTTADTTAPLDPEQISTMRKAGIDVSNWHDGMELGGIGYSDAVVNTMLSMSQQAGDPIVIPGGNNSPFHAYSTQPQPRKRAVIVDVAKFVKALTHSAVCLGRTCGFKRRDVDRALALASFDPF